MLSEAIVLISKYYICLCYPKYGKYPFRSVNFSVIFAEVKTNSQQINKPDRFYIIIIWQCFKELSRVRCTPSPLYFRDSEKSGDGRNLKRFFFLHRSSRCYHSHRYLPSSFYGLSSWSPSATSGTSASFTLQPLATTTIVSLGSSLLLGNGTTSCPACHKNRQKNTSLLCPPFEGGNFCLTWIVLISITKSSFPSLASQVVHLCSP